MKTLLSIWRTRHRDPEPWWYSILAAVAFFGLAFLLIIIAAAL